VELKKKTHFRRKMYITVRTKHVFLIV